MAQKGMATRRTILDGATELASRIGFNALSIGTLAEFVEMSKSGLYAHFRSKEQLQLQTLEHARRRFIDIVVRPALAVPDGLPRLRALFDHWLTWADSTLGGGCLFVAAAVEFDDQPGALRDALVRAERDWQEFLTTTVTAAADEQDLAVDPGQIAFEVHALLLGHHHASRLLLEQALATQRSRAGFDQRLATVFET